MTAQFLCMGKGIFRPHRIENPSTDTDQQNIGLNEKLKNCSVFTVHHSCKCVVVIDSCHGLGLGHGSRPTGHAGHGSAE